MPSLLGTGPGVHYKSLKTVNQSLKHKVNRCVLSLRLYSIELTSQFKLKTEKSLLEIEIFCLFLNRELTV